jgi:alkanesulfonate monooxygenase SsuD/methylene tetrahydromethanopterin reductase-like flavin-dependent oxidoreductase (luciferase family)
MKIGVYYTFRDLDPADDTGASYQEALDHVQAVEDLGYDYAFVAEHHFIDAGAMPSPLTVLGAFAAVTTHIGLGTYVVVLPLHSPIRLAEETAIVDRLSAGRMVLGIAAGYRREEFTALEMDRSQRGRAMERGVGILRQAWKRAPLPVEGVEGGVNVVPKPISEAGPPIWIGGFSPPAVDRAVRLGDGYLLGGAGAVRSGGPHALYREALARHGKSQADVPLIGNRIIHVGDTDEDAWAEARMAIFNRHNTYARWFKAAADQPGNDEVATPEDLPRHDYIVGSPETCIRRIHEYKQQFNVDVLTFDANQPGLALKASLRSLELFAKHVMPEVR